MIKSLYLRKTNIIKEENNEKLNVQMSKRVNTAAVKKWQLGLDSQKLVYSILHVIFH